MKERFKKEKKVMVEVEKSDGESVGVSKLKARGKVVVSADGKALRSSVRFVAKRASHANQGVRMGWW
ncbi:hypothetical protein AMTR_s00079p00191000 [Amborella trichopoda]|uniref:Uncharacterized protein n=1 Tax=Amborella trichopoda TaxID=13333 RepID=W1P8X3_AMBTC|nr:hypothetical protein AMTR_s00079p00191000 [Amborella trichopoda]